MDELFIEILPDGTVKTTTSKISAANHLNADAVLDMFTKLTGGKATREQRDGAKLHAHTHEHQHEHAHEE